MADIVICEFMDATAVSEAFAQYDVLFDPALVDKPAALAAAVRDARALIVRNRTEVRGALLAAATDLRVVGRLGVGLDNIDLAACRARNIAVCPASGANDQSVAEYVITSALMLLRGAWLSSRQVAAGDWPRTALIGREMAGQCLGLVGYGAIARETARRARALGMSVIACDPYLAPDSPAWDDTESLELDALLRRADVVSLHVPLTDETRHLIDAAAIGTMKKDAILINAARGGIVDEAALAAALRAGELGGAALDVFEREPLSGADGARFDDLSSLLLTPHIAGVTVESNVRVSRVTAANVLKHLE
ncbi:3-phosphoglycerate dehydrogenase [Exilibacterium tricleocarpae]|uniref:3-phosphoglycerate dehydrogenase n=1 Tax=Exilibacterium tricleocarpae TaxID=2591008 RepID=A0A545SS69_9GAMM|nr:NAD(P)-dependent oxidoreductase [Exilibacterium tricleocarpae]TQV67811.1 3-phosphoglycerate dehydrogenase [Exilibacterium tricleocarpae]